MEQYKIHLAIFLGSWIWCKFDPLQELIEMVFDKIRDGVVSRMLYTILSCWYCLGLWSALIVLGWDRVFEVIAISFACWFIESLIGKSYGGAE